MIEIGDALIAKNNAPLTGNSVAPPLEIGREYKTKGIYICGCGKYHINVGLVSKYSYVSCHYCKEELPAGDKIHWCHPSRFDIKNLAGETEPLNEDNSNPQEASHIET